MTIERKITGPNGCVIVVSIQTNLQAHSFLSERPAAVEQMTTGVQDAVLYALMDGGQGLIDRPRRGRVAAET